jgi:amino-acid N-acetyltransferase
MLQEISKHDAQFIAALKGANLPTDDLAEGDARYFSLGGETFGGIVNAGGVAMLRSMVACNRGQGDGSALLDELLKIAKAAGFSEAWLLTNTAESFFSKHKFQRVDRRLAPEGIRQTKQFSGLCPDTAALMQISLT